MTRLRPTVLAAALSAALPWLAAPASAADCMVNFVVNNPTVYRIQLVVETRTRANMNWYAGGLGNQGRWITVQPGARYVRPLSMPIVGCRVQRELRVSQTCMIVQGNTQSRMTDLVLYPWGRGLQAPRDVQIDVRC